MRTLVLRLPILLASILTAAWAQAAAPAPGAPPALPEEPEVTFYTVQPGDTLSGIASRNLGNAGEWKRLRALNRIADPKALKPGATLHLPPPADDDTQAAEAEVVLVRGDVRVRTRRQAPAAPLATGARLPVGSIVETGASGLLTLRFADGSRMLVAPNSRLALTRLRRGVDGTVATRATLEAGDVESFVMRLRGVPARYEVTTPRLNLAVRGTVFRVQFDEQADEARAMVSEGEVKAANAFGETFIPAGSGTRALAGHAPAAASALLTAPKIEAREAVVDGFPLRLSWQPLAEAGRYRVDLLDGDARDRLAGSESVAEAAARWRNLPNGAYRLRVRGVDAQRLEGANAAFDFTVRAWPAAPLTAAPADSAAVAGGRVRFRWARALDADALHFQLASDADFSRIAMDVPHLTGRSNGLTLPLAPGRYYWRIAAGNAADGMGPFGPTQTFEVREASEGAGAASAARQLRWRAGAVGERYAVQMASRADFAAPLVDIEAGVAEAAVPPDAGPVYVRIKRIAPDGFAGEFEPTQIFDPTE